MHKLFSVFSPRILARLLWMLTAGALAVCVAFVVGLAAWKTPPADLPGALHLSEAQEGVPAAEEKPASAYLAMAENPVFGVSAGSVGPPVPQQPRINACVVGTIVQGARSLAIVETDSGGQKLLRVGDALEGGRIVQITRGGIVLSVSGHDVEVPVTPSRRTRKTSAEPTPITPRRAVTVAPAQGSEGSEPEYEEDVSDIDLEEFESFAGELRTSIVEAATSMAHDVAGGPVGLVFDRVPNDSMLRRIGILPGDIIAEVNTMTVTSLQDLVSAFDKVAADVKSEDECFIVIEMIRDQKPDTIILTVW